MWRAVLVLLGGCQLVFELTGPDATPRDGAASDEMPLTDAFAGHCDPQSFVVANDFAFPGSNLDDITISEDESFMIGVDAGNIVYEQPPGSLRKNTTGLTQLYDRAGMTPNAAFLFLGRNGETFVAAATSAPASWQGEVSQTGIPIGFPGRPSSITRMMVERDDATFSELAFTAGEWDQLVGQAYTASELVTSATVVRFPNLTSDLLGLVYVVDDVAIAGIYYSRRATPAARFSPGTLLKLATAGT
ncbi:MAG: hypothetical protein ABI867_44455, partial [Kofleriaceae bacterium]